jgi:DNA-binding Xre family transcriptional regulator
MKKKIAKYFWDLNRQALNETENVLKNVHHPKFPERLVALLSRCENPKELFAVISRRDFVEAWPRVRSYWKRLAPESDFCDWWQSIYEQITARSSKKKFNKERPSALFLKIGRTIRRARLQKRLSQAELASLASMKQPDLSKIEEGKKNITLETLAGLCKALGIKKLSIYT